MPVVRCYDYSGPEVTMRRISDGSDDGTPDPAVTPVDAPWHLSGGNFPGARLIDLDPIQSRMVIDTLVDPPAPNAALRHLMTTRSPWS